MGIIFRANASALEKAFTVFLFGWIGMMLFGFYNGFRPESQVEKIGLYLAFPVSLIFFIPIVLDRHPSNQARSWGVVKRYIYYCLLLPVCFGFAWAGLAIGSASVATHFIGQEFAGEYTVTAKGDGQFRWRDRCNSHAIHFRNIDSSWNTKLCPNEAFWQKVKVGDVLFAKGRHSKLGVLIEEFELHR